MLKKTVEDAILARIPELLEPLLEEIDLTALMGNAVENILNAAFSGAPVPQLQQQRHTETTSSTSRDVMLPIHDFCRMLTKRGSAHTDFSNDVTAKPAIADNGGGGGGAPTAKSIDTTAGAESTSKDDNIDLAQLTADGSMWTVPVVHYDDLIDFIDGMHGRDASALIQCVVQIDPDNFECKGDFEYQEDVVLMMLEGKTFEITIVQLVEEQGDIRVPCLDDSGRQQVQHAKVTKRGSADTNFSHDVTAKPAVADNGGGGGGGGGAPTAKSNDTTARKPRKKAKKNS